MNNSTKTAIYLIGLGMSLVAFAFGTFATKEKVRNMHDDIRIIQADVKKLIGEID